MRDRSEGFSSRRRRAAQRFGAFVSRRVLPSHITIAAIPSRFGMRVIVREHERGNSGERGLATDLLDGRF